MFIPYGTDVLIKRWPIANFVIIGACVLFYLLLRFGALPLGLLANMLLTDWSPMGLIGHQFLHAGFWHLAGNMVYLWVFGNAISQRVGNLWYPALFLGTGVVAGALHNLVSGAPAVGASGAINGIVGFYLVLYPVNRIDCLYFFIFRGGTFTIRGFWMILFWFVIDAWQAFSGADTGVAYWAHVGGFGSGFLLGFLFVASRRVRMEPFDNPTLVDYLFRRTPKPSYVESGSRNRAPRFQLPLPTRPAPPPMPRPPGPAAGPSVEIDCPHCRQTLEITADMIGKAFPCPACGQEIELQGE